MKKILNPFINTTNGNCFACSTNNSQGLEMEFYEDGDYIVSNWQPKAHFAGFQNVLHGGVQTTIMDEIACWFVFVKLQTTGVTTSLNAKFRKSVFTNKGEICIRAKLISKDRRFANIYAEIINSQGEVCSHADVQYMIFPQEMAKKKFNYPGIEKFYEE